MRDEMTASRLKNAGEESDRKPGHDVFQLSAS